MYNIIEDCSPYYIRFTHENIQEIIDICKQELAKIKLVKNFTNYPFDKELSEKILNLVPMSYQYSLKKYRVSLFISNPGLYYRAHKDGADNRISFNYTVQILDNDCVTNWYSDEDLNEYTIEGLNWTSQSREAVGFDKTKHTPIKSMIAQPNECILFNTDIFHDFDNRQSKNVRAILTLRIENQGNYYFDDVKKTLFDL